MTRLRLIWLFDGPVDAQLGGTERVTLTMMEGLSKLGHQVLGTLTFQREEPNLIYYRGEKIADLAAFLLGQRIDVVINQVAYSPWLLGRFLDRGGEAWRLTGGCIISCLHFDPVSAPIRWAHLSRGWHRLSLRQKLSKIWRVPRIPYYNLYTLVSMRHNYRYVYDCSDLYVLLSTSHVRRFCRHAGIAETSKLTVIGNPLTFETSAADQDLESKQHTVLVVSRLDEPQKRISLALKAWRRLSRQRCAQGWRLVIVGDGPERGYYEYLINRWSLPRVILVGRQAPEEFYRLASILWMTSPREGWGQVLTEAQQFGVVPIVMNTSTVFSDIVQHDENGLLVPDRKLGAFTKCTAALMEDRYRRKRLARSAMTMSRRFALQDIALRWDQELNKVRGSGGQDRNTVAKWEVVGRLK